MAHPVNIARWAATALLCLGLITGAVAQTVSVNIPSDTTHRAISVKVTPGLTRTGKLPTAALRKARQRLLDGADLTPEELRGLAERWDGLAALKYVRHLVKTDAAASDIAYFGTIAVSTGRVWPLADVVAALPRLDPVTEPAARKKAYMAMLYPHAWAGNSLALDAVIDLNGPGKLFGDMSAATVKRLLETAEKTGDGRVPLRLALRLIQKPDRTAEDVTLARQYLALAQAGSNLAVQTTANNLSALLAGGGT